MIMEYDILNRIHTPEDVKSLSREEVYTLAAQIRAFLREKVLVTGGHLASNLGVVELSIALHRVFRSPHDHILFDVGHQSYVHKILTGRADRFDTLRTPGGLSGFTKRSESEHDPFGAGHASTSVSAALGFAEADRLAGSDAYTVAVLGDGAYSGGLVHEALNNCKKKLNLIIILNENEMSISPNTGVYATQISRIRNSEEYYRVKRGVSCLLQKIPLVGGSLFRLTARLKHTIKVLVYGSNYFEDLGLYYLGPVDGNDYDMVERVLTEAKLTGRTTLVHIKTTKGKGYAPAEAEPERWHGVLPPGADIHRNFSACMGEALCALAEQHGDLCAITAAMSDGTGLEPFRKRFPDRFFDVGIAEGHAVTFAAGLAAAGLRPVFAVYSSFLQRAYDNILHDVALQGLPVMLCVDRASLSGGDGPTHHGIYDVALLNTVPGMEIYAPATFDRLRDFLRQGYERALPCAIRYPNDAEFPLTDFLTMDVLRYDFAGKNPDKVVITYGKIVTEALRARDEAEFGIILLEKLAPYGRCADEIRRILPEGCRRVLFLEEGIYAGGAGMLLREQFPEIADFRILAIKDSFADGVAGQTLYESCGISYRTILEELDR